MVGVMNEFVHLADLGRADDPDAPVGTAGHDPVRPLFQRHTSPDRGTAAPIAGHDEPRQAASRPELAH